MLGNSPNLNPLVQKVVNKVIPHVISDEGELDDPSQTTKEVLDVLFDFILKSIMLELGENNEISFGPLLKYRVTMGVNSAIAASNGMIPASSAPFIVESVIIHLAAGGHHD